jgi:hypothetical protein
MGFQARPLGDLDTTHQSKRKTLPSGGAITRYVLFLPDFFMIYLRLLQASDDMGHHQRDDHDQRHAQQPKNDRHRSLPC